MYRLAFLFGVAAALWPAIALAQDAPGDTPSPGLTDWLNMPTATLWSIFAGILSTFLAAVVNRQRWPSLYKLVCWFVVCLITTGGTILVSGALEAESYFRVLLVILIASTGAYHATKSAIRELTAQTG